jgi:hypothetical protein
VAFPKIRKCATTIEKTHGENRQSCGFAVLRPSRADMLPSSAAKFGRYRARTLAEFDGSEYQKFPPCLAFDSLACWMRHPNPFISLLSLMLPFRIRAISHNQPLDDLP